MAKKRNKITESAPSDLRSRVVKAFLRISAEQGVARVTLQQVAAEAAVSFAGAYHYFGKGKLDLHDEASRFVAEAAQEFIQHWVEKAVDGGEDPLCAYYFGSFAWAKKFPEMAGYWIYHYHVLSFHPEKRAAHSEVIEVAQRRIQRLLTEGVGRGLYESSVNTLENCHSIHASLIGSMILAITDPAPNSYKKHSEISWKGVSHLLRQ